MHGVEEDIAEERLQLWISRSGQSRTSHDAVDGNIAFLALFLLQLGKSVSTLNRQQSRNL